MNRSRAALVMTTGFAILLLAGCGGGGSGGGAGEGGVESAKAAEAPQSDTAVSVHSEAVCDTITASPGSPIGKISLNDGQVSVDPDPIVQSRSAGVNGWRMAKGGQEKDDHFRIEFKNGSPLEGGTIFDSPDGKLVKSGVKGDAACGPYKYSVTVWPHGGGAPVTVDPTSDLVP
jgi:hypothetical protein